MILFTVVNVVLLLCFRKACYAKVLPTQQAIKSIVVFDAGSTGTRCSIYFFVQSVNNDGNLKWVIKNNISFKNSPGLSEQVTQVKQIIRDLLCKAKDAVTNYNAASLPFTKVYFRGTAGLRGIPMASSKAIIADVQSVFSEGSSCTNFVYSKEAAKLLSGEEEAAYAWVGANLDVLEQLKYDINPHYKAISTLDLGGGSTQVAYISHKKNNSNKDFLVLPLGNGDTVKLHVKMYNLGSMVARVKMVQEKSNGQTAPSECLHPNFASQIVFMGQTITMTGDKSTTNEQRFEKCYKMANYIVRKAHIEKLPKSISSTPFLGMSSFYFTLKSLASKMTFNKDIYTTKLSDLKAALEKICQTVSGDSFDPYAPYLCMDGCYILSLLENGYGFKSNYNLQTALEKNGIEMSWAPGFARIKLLDTFDIVSDK